MSLPSSVQKLLDAVDAGNVSVTEVPTAIRQAGGADFVLISIIREMMGGGGGGFVWGTGTGTVTDQTDLVTYISSVVAGLLDFKGNTDCSGNPNYPAALKGDAYVVSGAGKIGGESGKIVEVSDMYVANADNEGGTEASVGTSWFVLQAKITGITTTGLSLMRAADESAARTAIDLNDETPLLGIQGSNVASAPSIDLRNLFVTGQLVVVTGTSTITSIILDQGALRLVRFAEALTLTHGAGIILPGAVDIATAADDMALLVGGAANVTTCVFYQRAASFPGNVTGPASATDNAIVRYDAATGRLVQNSLAILDDSGNLDVHEVYVNPGANAGVALTSFRVAVGSEAGVVFYQGPPLASTRDLYLALLSTGVLGMQNGTNPCEFRVAGDASKYASMAHDGTNAVLNASSGNLAVAPGVALQLGNAAVTGLNPAVVAELLTKSVTIKDSTGATITLYGS